MKKMTTRDLGKKKEKNSFAEITSVGRQLAVQRQLESHAVLEMKFIRVIS